MRKDFWSDWIGQKVKKEKKPFKSGNKINTVNTMTINPNTGKQAFTFLEDDSIVDCHKCYLVDESCDT